MSEILEVCRVTKENRKAHASLLSYVAGMLSKKFLYKYSDKIRKPRNQIDICTLKRNFESDLRFSARKLINSVIDFEEEHKKELKDALILSIHSIVTSVNFTTPYTVKHQIEMSENAIRDAESIVHNVISYDYMKNVTFLDSAYNGTNFPDIWLNGVFGGLVS
ncbi:MAG: hypothetical protein WCK31_00795 [bacterium]